MLTSDRLRLYPGSMNLRRAVIVAVAALGLSLGAAPVFPAGSSPVTGAPEPTAVRSVVIISIDGLNPAAINRLGRTGAPTLHRLRREGAGTFNARTAYESTSTLPNHTGMVTGRAVELRYGGHGVFWNDERVEPSTVHVLPRQDVSSVFTVVAEHGGRPALFASKSKFRLFERSWPDALDRVRVQEDNNRLVGWLLNDLRQEERSLRFVHLSLPDAVGHEHRYMSKRYVRAVGRVDGLVRRILRTVESHPRLSGSTALLITSDHGGENRRKHRNHRRRENYRVPFLAHGPGIDAGADLYRINPGYRNPRQGRPEYDESHQPVRNSAVGNLALDLLGLPAIPGSSANAVHDLRVSARPPAARD